WEPSRKCRRPSTRERKALAEQPGQGPRPPGGPWPPGKRAAAAPFLSPLTSLIPRSLPPSPGASRKNPRWEPSKKLTLPALLQFGAPVEIPGPGFVVSLRPSSHPPSRWEGTLLKSRRQPPWRHPPRGRKDGVEQEHN